MQYYRTSIKNKFFSCRYILSNHLVWITQSDKEIVSLAQEFQKAVFASNKWNFISRKSLTSIS